MHASSEKLCITLAIALSIRDRAVAELDYVTGQPCDPAGPARAESMLRDAILGLVAVVEDLNAEAQALLANREGLLLGFPESFEGRA